MRLADAIVVNKIDSADNEAVAQVIANVHAVNPAAATSVWAGEQSNTTICVGTDVLFKLFRII